MNPEAPMDPDRAATPEKSERSRRGGVLLPFGLAALFVLSAAGFFYSTRDAGRETSSAPGSQQAARPADKDPASTPVQPSASVQPPAPPARSALPATEAPSTPPVASAPNSSATSSPPPTNQSPAAQAQGPTDSAPVETAVRPAPAPPTTMSDQPTSLPNDIVFVQKPGVNIRSEPSRAGRIVGSASKGRQFKVIRRAGSWVQVEGDATTGWIGGRLLGPQKP